MNRKPIFRHLDHQLYQACRNFSNKPVNSDWPKQNGLVTLDTQLNHFMFWKLRKNYHES